MYIFIYIYPLFKSFFLRGATPNYFMNPLKNLTNIYTRIKYFIFLGGGSQCSSTPASTTNYHHHHHGTITNHCYYIQHPNPSKTSRRPMTDSTLWFGFFNNRPNLGKNKYFTCKENIISYKLTCFVYRKKNNECPNLRIPRIWVQ